jgi:alcohol dehydrogenase, propanol-preferring
MGAPDVAGPHARGQSEVRIIGQLHDLVVVAERRYGQDRAEDLADDDRIFWRSLVRDRFYLLLSTQSRNAEEIEVMHGWAVVKNGVPLQEIDLPTPEPRGAQVLLKVTHCGVCHSDLYFQDGYYDLGGGKHLSLKDRGVSLPLVPGHETVGTVVAFGPDARNVAVGDHRIVFPWAGCGRCNRCQAGNEHLCLAPLTLGVFKSGGYGTHVIAERPEHLIDFGNVDPALAATYACSGITAYSAVKKLLPIAAEDPVVIVGAGGLGLAAIKILGALKHLNIVAVDVNPNKLGIAIEAGARASVDGRADDLAAQIAKAAEAPVIGVIDFVASSATARAGIDVLTKGGTYVPVGLYGGDITLQLPTIPLRGIAIRGSYVGSLAELKELVELAKSGALGASPVERVSHSHPNEALDRVRKGDVAGRLVLEVGAA